MGGIGPKELILIAIVILILFGSKKLPELMRGLGKGVKTFNDAKNSVTDELEGIKKPMEVIKNPIGAAKKEMSATFKSKSNSITDLDHEIVSGEQGKKA